MIELTHRLDEGRQSYNLRPPLPQLYGSTTTIKSLFEKSKSVFDSDHFEINALKIR